MFSDFVKRVIGNPTLPYTLGDKLPSFDSLWTVHEGIRKEDGSKVSIFSADCGKNNRDMSAVIKNCFKRCKTLRHPGVLKYLDGNESNDGNVWIMTEYVVPLATRLEELRKHPQLLYWGLYQISTVISFLNEDCQVIHGNCRIPSIYVTEGGEWKIFGFEITSSPKDSSSLLTSHFSFIPDLDRFRPPELQRGSWDTLQRCPVYCIDSWQMGLLIHEIFSGPFSTTNQVFQWPVSNIRPDLAACQKKLLDSSVNARMPTRIFLEVGRKDKSFFQTEEIMISEFLDSFSIKELAEKELFLKALETSFTKYAPGFCKYKILPILMNEMEFGSAGFKCLPSVFKIASLLDEMEFEKQINPLILKLCSNQDRNVRLFLLENIPVLADKMNTKMVSDKLFPSLANGFSDTAPSLREQTLKTITALAPKLNSSIINNDLMRHLSRMQMDEQPGIRVNTIISLGKVAPFLAESTRKKILALAFVKGLRDPFPQAKISCFMALSATLEYFDAVECSTKILPNIVPYLVDSDDSCRMQCLKLTEKMLGKIKEFSSAMPLSSPREKGEKSAVEDSGWLTSVTNKLLPKVHELKPSTSPTKASTSAIVKNETSFPKKFNAVPNSNGSKQKEQKEEMRNIFSLKQIELTSTKQNVGQVDLMSFINQDQPARSQQKPPKESEGWDDFEFNDETAAVPPTNETNEFILDSEIPQDPWPAKIPEFENAWSAGEGWSDEWK